MKKLLFFKILFSAFLLILVTNVSLASAEETNNESSVKNPDSYTFGEVETILVDYLISKGKDFEVGSKQYNDFIIDQYLNDTDQELANHPDYKAITAYMSEYDYQLSLYEAKKQSTALTHSKTIESSPTDLLNDIKNVTIGEIKEQITNEETKNSKLAKSTFATTASYSVSNAKAYAATWYNGRNPAFPVFTNDCTNFTSQILFAGGMKMNFDVYSGWYANTSDNSVSWSAVPEFFTYWSQRKTTVTSSSKSTIIADSKAGDIVQFKKDGATRWSHGMFVYEKSNSTIYLSGHTDNYLKRNIKDVSSVWVNFRVIKM